MHLRTIGIGIAAAAFAGLALAQVLPGQAGSGDAWSFESPRARAAKAVYDQGVRAAQERHKQELDRLKKPLLHVLNYALKQAERDQQMAEADKLRRAIQATEAQEAVSPTTEIVGWSARHNGHSYLPILAPVKWAEARAICKRLGGDLVCIETTGELVFLQKLTSGVGMYVGATDAHREGDWRWITKEPVDQAFWKVKEPDGGPGQSYAGLCIAGLYDVSDGDLGIKGFICEWQD